MWLVEGHNRPHRRAFAGCDCLMLAARCRWDSMIRISCRVLGWAGLGWRRCWRWLDAGSAAWIHCRTSASAPGTGLSPASSGRPTSRARSVRCRRDPSGRRLVQGHRVVLSVCSLVGSHRDSRGRPSTSARHAARSSTYTTRWDVTPSSTPPPSASAAGRASVRSSVP